MQVYYGVKANTYYIMSKEDDVAYMFSDLGLAIGSCNFKSAALTLEGKFREVDILSILGEGTKICEVYLNGYTAVINKGYLDVFSDLNNIQTSLSHMVYSLKHEARVKQLLIPYSKGLMSRELIESKLGKLDWKRVQ